MGLLPILETEEGQLLQTVPINNFLAARLGNVLAVLYYNCLRITAR